MDVKVLVVSAGATGISIMADPSILNQNSAEILPIKPDKGEVTVTVQVSAFPPSSDSTIILTLPVSIAVTKPLELTVATPLFEDDHVTILFVALAGLTDKLIDRELPTVKYHAG